MTGKEFFLDLFKDERGSTSIKPFIALIGCIFLCGAMLINSLGTVETKPNSDLIDAVMIITVIGMGADTLDKFSLRKKNETVTTPVDEPKN